MSHVSEKRWLDIRSQLSSLSNDTIQLMARIRMLSIQLFIMGTRAASGGDLDTNLAKQLFRDEIAERQRQSDAKYYEENPAGTEPPVVGPTALEIEMVSDARAVAESLNELWGAANNQVTPTRNRINDLHRIA